MKSVANNRKTNMREDIRKKKKSSCDRAKERKTKKRYSKSDGKILLRLFADAKHFEISPTNYKKLSEK